MTQVMSLAKADFKDMAADLAGWLIEQAKAHSLTYLLAHADDGVIWGYFQGGKLVTSGEAFNDVLVELRIATLQRARLFGPKEELLIWRTDKVFNGYFLTDGGSDESIEETYLLWGEASDPPGPNLGFTLMRDGQQGFLHAPPIELRRNQRAGLKARHYIQYDEQGQAYIALSRLVDFKQI